MLVSPSSKFNCLPFFSGSFSFLYTLYSTHLKFFFHPLIIQIFTISSLILSPLCQPIYATYLKCLFHPPVSTIFIIIAPSTYLSIFYSTYLKSSFHPPISPIFTISIFLLSPFRQPLRSSVCFYLQ